MSLRPRLADRRADQLAILFGLTVLAYAAARAVLVPITHDEAFTFLHWSRAPWRAIFLFRGPERANNHLLNTLLMKASMALFGPGEAALRLPNLLALASYLASLWLLLRRSRTAAERVALAFIALLALTVLAVKAQSVLFGLHYPTDRIAIPFIPLFFIAVTLAAATAPPTARKAATILLGGLALLATIHLVRVADTRQSALWWFDADVRRAVSDISDYALEPWRPRPLRVGSVSHCQPALEYMRVVGKLGWLAPVERLGTSRWDYDLCYVTTLEAADAERRGFTVYRRYPETGNLLLLPPKTP